VITFLGDFGKIAESDY